MKSDPEKNPRPRRAILDTLTLLFMYTLAAFFIVLPIRFFVAQPFFVSGDSMEPTFMPNEYLVIDKLYYRMHEPQRGDVIIMRYPLDPSTYLVKRVIGVPGETVSISNGKVTVTSIDGSRHVLDEPYLKFEKKDATATTTLSKDEYFVLGDNRFHSSDSREWGPLQSKFIVGRAFVRLYPFRDARLLPGQHRYTDY